MKKQLYILLILLMGGVSTYAGNPDRQGEAGATELLLNPWAKSAGLHSMSTSSVSGVESMRINVAGLSRINSFELAGANSRLYEGTGIQQNAIAFATKMGEFGAIGVSLVSMNFGDIPITTTDQPGGNGGTYSPSFFNLGLGYSYTYKGTKEGSGAISVGVLVRAISESTPDVSASGFGVDAGVQYISGEKENFKLGISLRNIGTPMSFSGEGLSFRTDAPESSVGYKVTSSLEGQSFELPSLLNIGLSYDYYFSEEVCLRGVGNFTSNAFSSDQIGLGLELMYNDLVTLRGAYKMDISDEEGKVPNVYTGLAAGVSIDVPLKRASGQVVGIDYAYRATNPFKGTHNFTLRLGF